MAEQKNYLFQRIICHLFLWPGVLFMIAGITGMIMPDSDKEFTPAFMAFLMGLVPAAVCTIFLFRIRNKLRGRMDEATERMILNLAKTHKGVLTVGLLSSKTELSMSQSKELLGKMVINGAASADSNSNGAIEYVFHDFVK
jgi:hypothetical protein